MMSLYAQYISERQGLSIIERPQGFVSYRIVGRECFLSDIFVPKSIRRSEVGRSILKELTEVAKAKNCNVVTANIFTKDPNANDTLKAALACGFEIKSSGIDCLLIAKELGGI